VNANLMVLRLIRLTRVFRVLKMGNLGAAKEVLTDCITLSKPSLGMVLFIVAMQVLISSCLVYYAEAGHWDSETQTHVRPCSPAGGEDLCQSPFSSIPATFWWTIETVTTVGYGDFSPTTGIGRLLGAFTIIVGVITFALPVGIIASNFDIAQAKYEARGQGTDSKQQADDDAIVAVLMNNFGVDGRAEIRFDVYDYDGPLQHPDFLGYCCLDVRSLGLTQDKPENVVFTIPLREDYLLAARNVSGSITLCVQWVPEEYVGPKTKLHCVRTKHLKELHAQDSLAPVNVTRIPPLKGKLTVKIVRARDLLNLDTGQHNESDPFVVASLYDQHTSPPNFVRWETPVVHDNCSPDFNVTKEFDINWSDATDAKPPLLVSDSADKPPSYDRTPPDDKTKRLSTESVDAILAFPAEKILALQEQLSKIDGVNKSVKDEFLD
jgi:hypothetical protein